MDNEIGNALEALALDTNRCSQWSAALVRRRGDRRRTASRLAATGVTVTLVGATAGTAYAVAEQPTAPHGSVSPAGQSSQSQSQSQSPAPVPPHRGSATPTPTPTSSSAPVPTARPSRPSSSLPTGTPTPTHGYRGSATPTASPSPSAG